MVTINDALRMVGHLLLQHPAIGELAYDRRGNPIDHNAPEAACWCYEGACYAVAHKLGHGLLGQAVYNAAQDKSGCANFREWDRATDEQQSVWATRLTQIVDP